MQKLNDLIKKYDFDEIWGEYIKFYPEEKFLKNKFKKVYQNLKSQEPKSECNIKIIFNVKVNKEKEILYDVYGLDLDVGLKVDLSFSYLKNWLDFYIANQNFLTLSESEFVAHCLWEITYNGFNKEDREEKRKEVLERKKNFNFENAKKIEEIL